MPDLVSYDPIGDGIPSVAHGDAFDCRPTADACGAILAQGVDFDGDGSVDVPPYRLDFYGNWTIDGWQIGETCGPACPEQDLLDIFKNRIESPHETEQVWDLQDPSAGGCAVFDGYIDGPVRVVRVIQGAASGGTTRKTEFAYPGEFLRRIYLRVHMVQGPIFYYPDVQKSTVGTTAEFRAGEDTSYSDTIQGEGPIGRSLSYDPPRWWQVSSPIGSYLIVPGLLKSTGVTSQSAQYDDTDTPLWADPPTEGAHEWDGEPGEHGAPSLRWAGLPDTQNPVCADPLQDGITPIADFAYIALGSGAMSGSIAAAEATRRNRGVISQCIVEEIQDVGSGVGPCPPPTLSASYGHDSEPVGVHFSINCPNVAGWNLYEPAGAGVYRRLASLRPDATYFDASLQLNESKTYFGTSIGTDCSESAMSSAVTVLHDDTVAPPPPTDVAVSAVGASIVVEWSIPVAGDLEGYRVLSSEQPGGPYTVAHQGLIDAWRDTYTVQATTGTTYYLVMTALDHAGNESAQTTEVSVAVP